LAQALEREGMKHVRLVAVQARTCPGLTAPGGRGRTRAAGIGIANPPRREEILCALRQRGGEIELVTEAEIEAGTESLAGKGVWAEPAAGAAEAALDKLQARGETGPFLGWLTGSGLRG
jgi:threonine synthase